MRKAIILTALAIVLFISEKAHAQFNINVGYAPEFFSTTNATDDNTTLYFDGLCIGLNWKLNLTNHFNLTTGAQFRLELRDKAESYHNIIFHHTFYSSVREQQELIDIPIQFHYDIALTPKVSLSPFVGSMLSWGLYGKTHEEYHYPLNVTFENNWYGKDFDMNRFNVYGTTGIKVCYKKFTLSSGYRWGFLDLNKLEDTTTKTHGFFIVFGHDF